MFEYKNIAPDDPKLASEGIVANIEMPYIEGLSLAQAVAKLNALGLQVEIAGEGGIVKQQLPPAGTMLYKGAVVQITT